MTVDIPGRAVGNASWDDFEEQDEGEFEYDFGPDGEGPHDAMGAPVHDGYALLNAGPGANVATATPTALDHPLDNAMREMTGERVARRDLDLDDIITLADGSQETLRALVNTGEVVRDVRSGMFRFANEPSPWAAGAKGQAPETGEAPRDDTGKDGAKDGKEDDAYKGDPLPKELEQELGVLSKHVPEDLQDALATRLINGLDLDADVVSDFAAATGLDDTQAQAKLVSIGQAVLDKASEIIEAEGVPAGLVWAALRDGDGHQFSEVMHEYLQGNRDARPLRAAARKALAGLARNNPQELLNAELHVPQGGPKARIVEKNKGDVYLAIAHNETDLDGEPVTRERLIPWQSAVKQGMVTVRPKSPGKSGLKIKV